MGEVTPVIFKAVHADVAAVQAQLLRQQPQGTVRYAVCVGFRPQCVAQFQEEHLPLLGTLALGDVGDRAVHSRCPPRFSLEHGLSRKGYPPHRAARLDKAGFNGELAFTVRVECSCYRGRVRVAVVRVDHVRRYIGERHLARALHPKQLQQAHVRLGPIFLHVPHVRAQSRRFDGQFAAQLASAQRFLGVSAFHGGPGAFGGFGSQLHLQGSPVSGAGLDQVENPDRPAPLHDRNADERDDLQLQAQLPERVVHQIGAVNVMHDQGTSGLDHRTEEGETAQRVRPGNRR